MEDICSSFNNVFNENQGWIITKNQKGKIKVAVCDEDESNIYDKTRDWIIAHTNETRTDFLKLPKQELYKTANFFIRDLLDAIKEDTYFVYKDITFNNVFICGTITSVYPRNENVHIAIDDGTSSILCIISKQNLKLLKEGMDVTQLGEMLMENKNNYILQAAALTISSKKSVEDSVPSFDDLELGDIVKLIGKLSEHEGNRYVFIQKITKEPQGTISHYMHLNDMIYLYTEVYED